MNKEPTHFVIIHPDYPYLKNIIFKQTSPTTAKIISNSSFRIYPKFINDYSTGNFFNPGMYYPNNSLVSDIEFTFSNTTIKQKVERYMYE